MKTDEVLATGGNRFHRSVVDLLKRVRCRRVVQADDLEEVFRLRYASYLREGAIAANVERSFSDRFDDLPNTWILGFYIEDRLASSLRIGVANRASFDIPAMTVFEDLLAPSLQKGETIVDPTRFVIDEEHARAHPKLAFVTSRASWLATQYFCADATISTVRVEHQAFYRRYHGQEVVGEARRYPTLLKPLSLMSGRFGEVRHILERYPFLKSTPLERSALFDPPGLGVSISRRVNHVSIRIPDEASRCGISF